MDIKKRTKSVKEKLNQLGYNVKLTHCREVLAVAHGLRNSHQFEKPKKEKKIKNHKEMFLTLSLCANNTNDFYSDLIKGAKVHLSTKDIESIMKAKEFVFMNEKADVELAIEDITPFEDFKSSGFHEEEDAEEMEDILYSGIILDDSEFYQNDNVYVSDLEKVDLTSGCIVVDRTGVYVQYSCGFEDIQVLYSSDVIEWDKFDKENKEKLKPQTIVYLQVEEDPCERRETNKGFSCALMYLGTYTEEHIKNKETLETLAEHLWENDSYVDDLMNEIMDRSNYFSTEKEAFEDAFKLAKKLGYYVVNKSDCPS